MKKNITHKFLNGPVNKKNFLGKNYLGITEFISNYFNQKKIEELEKWLGKEEIVSTFKIDGSSCSVVYLNKKLILGKTRGDGSFSAAFDGEHGWFWRNRDKRPAKITLLVTGDYDSQ